MAGALTEPDVLDDLKRSLHDAAGVFNAAGDTDFRRFLAIALVAMQTKRPRTLLGSVWLTAGEARYPLTLLPDFCGYKTHVWASRPLNPWDPSYPGGTPRVRAVNEGGSPSSWALAFDPPPSPEHVAAYGREFKFWYFAAHRLALQDAGSTIAPADRPLLLLRAQAEAMRELAMRNSNKPVQVRDGLTGAPRNSTPTAIFQALLEEFDNTP
jgi:hypothetical protein